MTIIDTAPLPRSGPAPDAAADPIIRTEKLSHSYSSQGRQQHVLKNIDLAIDRGEFVVIMGPSGAGKSTLLYALSGMDRPSLGSIVFDGTDITRLSQDRLARFRRTHCGFVFQQMNLLDTMSVRDNVLAPGLLTGRRRHAVAARADELFDRVELAPELRDKFPGQLSGGEAQRVGLVRALVNDPAVVFADEPTGQLNSASSGLVLDLLSGFHAGGQTVVMVTHDLRSALRGSRILYLRDGAIRGECLLGPYDTDRLATRERELTAFLSRMGGDHGSAVAPGGPGAAPAPDPERAHRRARRDRRDARQSRSRTLHRLRRER